MPKLTCDGPGNPAALLDSSVVVNRSNTYRRKRNTDKPDDVKQYVKRAYDQARYLAKRDEIIERTSTWIAANAEKHAQLKRRWNRLNAHKVRSMRASRRAREISAAAAWANQEAMESVYALAITMTCIFGKPYEVDHVLPLQGETVCGLHVEHNLAVLSRKENRGKHNRLTVPRNETC